MAKAKTLYELGETPPLGHVPRHMYASAIRQEQFGEPRDAFRVEAPRPGPQQALVWMMASGAVGPALAHLFAFGDIVSRAHQMLHENTPPPPCDLAIRVNVPAAA